MSYINEALLEEERLRQHGGKRPNSGVKPKYGEPTKTIAFRCPASKVQEIKALIADKLAEWKV